MMQNSNSAFAQKPSRELDVLLIGKSLNGKSATGNSILDKEEFQRNTQSSLVTTPQKLIKKSKVTKGYTINIVDGLNVGESTKTDRGDIERDISSLTDALKICHNGFSVLLIVVKFGVKFSDEEVDALNLLKSILGDSVLKQYGVLVVSYGDNYQKALKQGEFSSFGDWCSGQPTGLQNLVKECQNRYALFNNRAKSIEEKKRQFDNLFEIIKEMHTKRYSEKEFEIAKKRHEELKNKKKPQEMVHKTNIVVENVREKLKEVETSETTNAKKQELKKLAKQLNEHQTLVTESINSKCKEVTRCSTEISVLHEEILCRIRKMEMNEKLFGAPEPESCVFPKGASLGTPEPLSSYQKQNVKVSKCADIEKQRLLETNQCLRSIKRSIEQTVSRYEDAKESFGCEIKYFINQLHVLKKDLNQVSNNETLLSDIETTEQKLHQSIQQISVSICKTQNKKMKVVDAKEVTEHGVPRGSATVEETQAACFDSNVSQKEPHKGCQLLDANSDAKDISNPALLATWEIKHSADERNDLSLILIGPSGYGKSATGNSIVGKSAFETTSSMNAANSGKRENIQKESVKFENTELHVIDGPSIDYSAKDKKKEFENFSNTLEKSLELSGDTFSAILIIVKFGKRFSKQDCDFIELIKRVLGNDIIRNFGICVITHGDNFQSEVKQAKRSGEVMTFEGWCREQEGDLKNLFEECNDRVVLFNNKEKDEGKKKMQVEKLVDMIEKRIWYSKEYTIPQDVDRKTM